LDACYRAIGQWRTATTATAMLDAAERGTGSRVSTDYSGSRLPSAPPIDTSTGAKEASECDIDAELHRVLAQIRQHSPHVVRAVDLLVPGQRAVLAPLHDCQVGAAAAVARARGPRAIRLSHLDTHTQTHKYAHTCAHTRACQATARRAPCHEPENPKRRACASVGELCATFHASTRACMSGHSSSVVLAAPRARALGGRSQAHARAETVHTHTRLHCLHRHPPSLRSRTATLEYHLRAVHPLLQRTALQILFQKFCTY
jgi:hypothetical protein